jgi:trehalose-6-phosphate synthase
MRPIISSLPRHPLVMGSIDSYHPISGLKNKLLSYELFLKKYPNYQNRVVLI